MLAKIFNGTIKTWNDPKIAKLNPGVTLPATPITVFFRSDESGTTENSPSTWPPPATAPGRTSRPSRGPAPATARTSPPVSPRASTAPRTRSPTSSGVREGQQARHRADRQRRGPVELTAESVGKAVAEAEVEGQAATTWRSKLEYATTAAGAYPVLLVTYEIVCSKGLPAEKTALVKDFLSYFASSKTARAR